DAVERDDERWLAAAGDQVVGMRVGIWPDPERQALVYRSRRQPVEFGASGLDNRDPGIGSQLDCLADPLVRVQPGPDVQGGRGPGWPERLKYRITAGADLCRSARPPGSAIAGPPSLPTPGFVFRGGCPRPWLVTPGRGCPALSRVTWPHLGWRSR